MSLIQRSAGRPTHQTVLVAAADTGRWELVRVRAWDRVLVRCRQLTLDSQLAAGQHTDDDRLIAIRAGTLTALPERQKLAAYWENVLTRTTRPRHPADPRVPVQRSPVLAAADDIRHMIGVLRTPNPVSARGVALANLLLTDGTGPLYNSRSTADLAVRVQDAIRYLDPLTDLPASITDA